MIFEERSRRAEGMSSRCKDPEVGAFLEWLRTIDKGWRGKETRAKKKKKENDGGQTVGPHRTHRTAY